MGESYIKDEPAPAWQLSPYAKPGPYITPLTPQQQPQFQRWVQQNNIPYDSSPTADYDMPGYWAAGGKAPAKVGDHFPDTYKTPYHRSFSRESKYATPDAPYWKDKRYLVDKTGQTVFDEGPQAADTSRSYVRDVFPPVERPTNFDAPPRSTEAFTKPYQSPHAPIPADLQKRPDDIGRNFATGARQWGQAMGTLGTLPWMRVRESYIGDNPIPVSDAERNALPQKKFDLIEPIMKMMGGPVIASIYAHSAQPDVYGTMPWLRGSDAEQLGQGINMLGKYFEQYETAATQPNFLGYLFDRWRKDPLGALDLSGPAIGGAAMKGITQTGKITGQTAKLAQAMKPVTATVKKGLAYAPDWLVGLNPLLPAWVRELTPAGEQQRLIFDKIRSLDEERLSKILTAEQDIQGALDAMPVSEHKYLLPGAIELTDRAARNRLYGLPGMGVFMARMRRYSEEMRRILQVPDIEHTLAVYGPMYLSVMNRLRKQTLKDIATEYPTATPARQKMLLAQIADNKDPLKYKNVFYNPDGSLNQSNLKRLQQMQRMVESKGGGPMYAGVVGTEEIGRQKNRSYSQVLGGMSGKTAAVGKEAGEGKIGSPFYLPDEERPGFLRERKEAGAQSYFFKPPSGPPTEVHLASGKIYHYINGEFGGLKRKGRNGVYEDTRPSYFLDPQDADVIAQHVGNKHFRIEAEGDKLNIVNRKTKEIIYSADATRSPGIGDQPVVQHGRTWKVEEPVSNITNLQRPGARVESIRKQSQSMSAKDVMLDRLSRTYSYDAIRKLFDWLGESQPASKKDWVEINLKNELLNHAKEAGADPQAIQRFFKQTGKETLMMPKNLAQQLSEGAVNLFRDMTVDTSTGRVTKPIPSSGGIMREVARTQNKFLFGADPMFGIRLALQTGTIQGLSARSPDDVLKMLASYAIAGDKRVQEMMPPSMLLSHGGILHDPILGAPARGWTDKLLNPMTEAAYDYHNYQRRAAAVHFLLTRAEGAPDSLKKVIAGALEVDTVLQDLRRGVTNPKVLAQLRDHMKGLYGDYSALTAQQRQLVRDIFPVAQWGFHAANTIMTLPVSNPTKVALMSGLRGVVPELLQDKRTPESMMKRGALPVKTHEGKFKKGPQGNRMYLSTAGLEPLGAGLGLIATAGELVWPSGQEIENPGGLNALLTVVPGIVKGVDVQRGDKYQSPELARDKFGRQYEPSTGEQIKRVAPVAGLVTAEGIMPKQTAAVQRGVSFMDMWVNHHPFYEPSKFTYPGHPAPETTTKHGHTKPRKGDIQEAILSNFGIGAREAFRSPAEESRAKRRNKRDASAAVRRFKR